MRPPSFCAHGAVDLERVQPLGQLAGLFLAGEIHGYAPVVGHGAILTIPGYQTERSSSATSAGVASRGFILAAGTHDDRLGDVVQLVLGDAEIAQPLEAAEPGELLGARDRIVRAHRLAEALDRLRGDRLVEAQRGRKAERVRRAVRDPVAAAERLRHRVGEPHPRAGERRAGVHRALEELLPALAGFEHPRQRLGDERRAGERLAVGLVVSALDVERLGAVRERVHRRSGGLAARQRHR